MRILIAEDDPYSLKILQLMLKSEQCYDIVGVTDGEAAWRELESGLGFNLCILDIMMPGLDGLQLAQRIRQDPRLRPQPIIFCTALNDRHTIDQAAALGVSHYIVKPYAKEHVLRQVRRVCEETPASVYFEAQSAVIARLGVGGTDLRLFLQELHGELADFAAAVAGGAVPEQLRVNALKGAAINLGARALGQRLGQIESALAGKSPSDPTAALAALEIEIERLRVHLGLERKPAPAIPGPASSQAVPALNSVPPQESVAAPVAG